MQSRNPIGSYLVVTILPSTFYLPPSTFYPLLSCPLPSCPHSPLPTKFRLLHTCQIPVVQLDFSPFRLFPPTIFIFPPLKFTFKLALSPTIILIPVMGIPVSYPSLR